jgi:hypothetical protein
VSVAPLPNWRRNALLYQSFTKVTQTIGTFVHDVNGRAVVNVGESSITVRYATRYKPQPGDGVLLQFFGNDVRIVGPTAARNGIGKVTAIHDPYLTVLVDGKSYSLPYAVTYQTAGPHVNDTVGIDWEKGYVTGAVTAAPTGTNVPVKLTTDQKPFDLYFYAAQSGSYDTSKNRWSSKDLYCDSSHQAAWFYGTKVARSLKDDAYISSVEVYLPLKSRSGAEPTVGRHSDAAEKSGGVYTSDGAVRGWKGWIQLPTAWGDDWKTTPGGVTISGGNSIYRGIGTDRQSGKLRIRGRQ